MASATTRATFSFHHSHSTSNSSIHPPQLLPSSPKTRATFSFHHSTSSSSIQPPPQLLPSSPKTTTTCFLPIPTTTTTTTRRSRNHHHHHLSIQNNLFRRATTLISVIPPKSVDTTPPPAEEQVEEEKSPIIPPTSDYGYDDDFDSSSLESPTSGRPEERFEVLNTGIHECRSCGYQYNEAAGDPSYPVPPGLPFTSLPEDWRCATCGAAKSFFVSKSVEIAGFAENQQFGLGGNTLTSGQKAVLIYGSLLLGFIFFLSGYFLQ